MTCSRRTFVSSIALLVAGSKARAQTRNATDGDDWPTRPVRFIVPAAAGSAGDDVCRLVAAKLGDRFGQQFVIVNQPAAGGTLGIQDLARAAPDGYTIGQISTSTQVIAKLYNPALWYDGLKDFAPISLLGNSPYVLAVYPGLAVKNVAELVELAKRQPLNNGAFGTTSLGYLASKLFEREAGIRLNQVPYRSSAQAVIDVVAGRVEMQFSTLPPAIPLIRTGKLRALATTGAQRFATLADVPTLAESGFAGFDVALWLAMAAPAGTPPKIIAKLNSELVSLLNGAEMRDAMLRQSFVAESSSPDALAERIRADLAKWRDVVASRAQQKIESHRKRRLQRIKLLPDHAGARRTAGSAQPTKEWIATTAPAVTSAVDTTARRSGATAAGSWQ